MSLFRKKQTPTHQPTATPYASRPSVDAGAPSPEDFARATAALDRWDAAAGNSDATWSALEGLIRLGGWKGFAAWLTSGEPSSAEDRADAPWRWWSQLAKTAVDNAQPQLAARVFLFVYLVLTQFKNEFTPAEFSRSGLSRPQDATVKEIALRAWRSFAFLAPEHVIYDGPRGRVDVLYARDLARDILGDETPLVTDDRPPLASLGTFVTPQQQHDFADAAVANKDSGDEASRAYALGIEAGREGRDGVSLQHMLKAAELGHVEAMYEAGCLLMETSQHDQGLFWLEAAALGGNAFAAQNIGVHHYQSGDDSRAIPWFEKAIQLGDFKGYRGLMAIAERAGDADAERRWAAAGSAAGDSFCMGKRAQHLAQETSSIQSLRSALDLGRMAANKGDVDSMLYSGVWANILGDREEAHKWLLMAQENDHPSANQALRDAGFGNT